MFFMNGPLARQADQQDPHNWCAFTHFMTVANRTRKLNISFSGNRILLLLNS